MIKLRQLFESSAKDRLKKKVSTHGKLRDRVSTRYKREISSRFKYDSSELLEEFRRVRSIAKSDPSVFGEVLASVLAQDIYAHADIVGEIHPSLDRELEQLKKECLQNNPDPIEFFASAAEVFELFGGIKFHS